MVNTRPGDMRVNCAIDRLGFEEKLMTQDDIRIFDWSAIGISAGAFWEILPSVSALLSVIWIGLRIVQTIREIKRDKRKD